MTIISVRHATTYRYTRPVRLGEHRMMFRPRDSYDQRLIESSLLVEPQPSEIHWLHDAFTNCVAVACFDAFARELRFESRIILSHAPSITPEVRIEESAKFYPFSYSPEELPDLAPCIARAYPDPDRSVEKWVQQFVRRSRPTPTGELLKTITYAIKDGFAYARRPEPGTWSPAKTLIHRRGSCRDLALFMMEAARALGLAARFVSGYIYVPDLEASDRIGGGATHAWCQIYLPGAGWVEFDPTNGIVGSDDLIRVAVARDPSQAIPLSGVWYGEAQLYLGMNVEVEVTKSSTLQALSTAAA
jgi:transglutaminase-like putative cysteine protease